jgi:hypothetical protein
MTDLIVDGLVTRRSVAVELGPCDRPELLGPALRTYLEGITRLVRQADLPERAGLRFSCYQELVLKLGRPYRAGLLPAGARRGRMGYCYANTLALISDRPHLRYVEGFAMPWVDGSAGAPAYHCWAATAGGRVWDPTWPEPEHSAYFGVQFNLADVARFIALDEDTFGILETEHLIDSPLLRTGRLWPAETSHARR